ncbi:alpha/beta fold hydrolase [Streptomyces sclerotialus]|uniref:alpha/beta fold hydrolase n=1 Tax=Streptomyces sclerotialus TaxID=1957 RepID=UPI00099D295E
MRRGSVWAGVCGVLAVTCLTVVPQPGRAAAAPRAQVAEDARGGQDPYLGTYAYGTGQRRTVGVYRVPGQDVRPAVMILHGGYWAQDSDWSGWARKLAARGFVVFDVDYRLNTDARWPAQRTDALTALHWIRARADRFRADPRRVVLLGSSAGGQLAANTAEYAAGTAYRPAGVVALSPVADPYLAWRDGARSGASAEQRRLRREAQKLAGCDPGTKRVPTVAAATCRAVWDDMAARTWAPGGPRRPGGPGMPMLLLHFADDFVPVAHSRGLAKAEPEAAVSVVPGPGHGMKALTRPATERQVLAFLTARTQPSVSAAGSGAA